MLAMIGVLWTYDGWVNASARLAEEIKDPGSRNIPRALDLAAMMILIDRALPGDDAGLSPGLAPQR